MGLATTRSQLKLSKSVWFKDLVSVPSNLKHKLLLLRFRALVAIKQKIATTNECKKLTKAVGVTASEKNRQLLLIAHSYSTLVGLGPTIAPSCGPTKERNQLLGK